MKKVIALMAVFAMLCALFADAAHKRLRRMAAKLRSSRKMDPQKKPSPSGAGTKRLTCLPWLPLRSITRRRAMITSS